MDYESHQRAMRRGFRILDFLIGTMAGVTLMIWLPVIF